MKYFYENHLLLIMFLAANDIELSVDKFVGLKRRKDF